MKRLSSVLLLLLALTACGPRQGTNSSRSLIQNKGSDTLVNVAQAWAEAYKDVEPSVGIAVTGGGSGTGISALINGTVDIANASRSMKTEEIELAREHGIEPREFVVGYDALAVYLNHSSPVDHLTIAQLAEIYGEGGRIHEWKDLGVQVPGCDSDEIVRVSRQNNSGTYTYFKEAILGDDREYELGSRDMHGSKDVVDLVAQTPCAIGYSGLAYTTDEVKMPCISTGDESACVTPSIDTAIDGSYPIARPLLMYSAGEPEGAVKAYLDWILSDAGQCIILEKGYAPARPVSCS